MLSSEVTKPAASQFLYVEVNRNGCNASSFQVVFVRFGRPKSVSWSLDGSTCLSNDLPSVLRPQPAFLGGLQERWKQEMDKRQDLEFYTTLKAEEGGGITFSSFP
ncbi:uncharacterized protein LOC143819861 isoform X2 [Paroedura picta]|uniref:uncharacterized protein LOC143819861 isoform X2 n=1 Tax=Paroedura picta TaxID=143630 RepID=UPI00405624D4